MKRIMIMDEYGIHARPASDIVSVASKHEGNVYLIKSGKIGNAKSVLMVLSLGIIKGDTIDIVAEGQDSENIEAEIENVIMNSGNEVLL